ncbi:MAG: PQQ-binding-like beta-propeller repeat protein [Pirellulaceae bacterium]
MNTIFRTLLSFAFLCLSCHVSLAGDWPQFRFGANRGASSSEQLAPTLHLQWERDFATPSPAFPGDVRLRYDATYQPVVMGETIFVPSMVTDSVTALDTSSGEVRWQFFTGGPVRFAPIVTQGAVYFGSDDGYVYCLDATKGTLRWKVSGRPAEHKARNLLGNRRLIPMWPVRGGPVLDDGIIYFAVGLWPEDEIFVNAIHATTGQLIWSNGESSKVANANLDHGVQQETGLTPQGYLAVLDGQLVAPCGTQLPAIFNLKTGKLEKYTTGWGGRVGLPKGTWFVAGSGQLLTHSGDLYDMRRPNDEKFANSGNRADFKSKLYPGFLTRIQIEPTNQKSIGNFRRPVFSSDTMFYTDNGIVAEDITEIKLTPRTADPRREKDKYPDKWQADFPQRWKLATDLRVRIQAGKRVYATAPGKIAAIDLPANGGEPKISWQAAIDGDPLSLVAANGRLFVTTRAGRLYAFGETPVTEPVTHAKPALPATAQSEQVRLITKATGINSGYCLVLGLKNGELAEALSQQFTVIAIDDDAARINTLRKRWHAQGIYGSRITVHQGDPLTYSLPPFLATLVVSETARRFNAEAAAGPLANVYHALRPYGGTACLPVAREARQAWKDSATEFSNAQVRESGRWLLLSRSGALAKSADWSHAAGGSGNTGSSEDRYLRGPLGLLWYDGSIRWERQPGKTEVRVAGGRILVRADRMLAIDVFTGRRLWDQPLPQAAGAGSVGEFVATGDAIYVAAGRSCVVLDAETGKQRARFQMPEEISGTLIRLRLWKNYLVSYLDMTIICLDRLTGKLLWSFEASRPELSLAVGGNRVFIAELLNSRRGETIEKSGVKTYALDIATGKQNWQGAGGAELRYSETHDLLLTATAIYKGFDGSVHREAVIADPTKDKWNYKSSGYIAGDSLLIGGSDNFTMYQLTSGVQLTKKLTWFRRGCTPLRASPYMVTTRYQGNAAYIDLDTMKFQSIWNLRGACSNNIFPANGILNVPNLSGGCTCNYTPTSMALVPRQALQPKAKK